MRCERRDDLAYLFIESLAGGTLLFKKRSEDDWSNTAFGNFCRHSVNVLRGR